MVSVYGNVGWGKLKLSLKTRCIPCLGSRSKILVGLNQPTISTAKKLAISVPGVHGMILGRKSDHFEEISPTSVLHFPRDIWVAMSIKFNLGVKPLSRMRLICTYYFIYDIQTTHYYSYY